MSQNPGVADGAMNYAGGDQIAYADGNGSAQISGDQMQGAVGSAYAFQAQQQGYDPNIGGSIIQQQALLQAGGVVYPQYNEATPHFHAGLPVQMANGEVMMQHGQMQQGQMQNRAMGMQGNPGQAPVMKAPQAPKPWHGEGDEADKRAMVDHIIEMLKQRKPGATEDWTEKLPQMAHRLESALYYSANSKVEYIDRGTLKARLHALAHAMGGKSRTNPNMQQQMPQGHPGAQYPGQPGYTTDGSQLQGDPSQQQQNYAPGQPGQAHVQQQQQQPPNPELHRQQVLKQQQQRLLLLRHASKCPHENNKCTVTPHCANMKTLWKHIMSCKDQDCKTAHCVSSRYVLSHYSKCKDPVCPVCGPVREAIRRNYDWGKDVVRNAAGNYNRAGYGYNPGNPAKKHKADLSVLQQMNQQKLEVKFPVDAVSCPLYCFTPEQIENHYKTIHEGMRYTAAKIKDLCLPVLDDVLREKYAHAIFGAPVDPVAMGLPDYNDIVKVPMDLGTVRKRLETSMYRDMEHFRADVHLTFDNAMMYNPKASDVYGIAKDLKRLFDANYRKLMGNLEGDVLRRRLDPENCGVCGELHVRFEPPVFYCNGRCGSRIRRSAWYYHNAKNTIHMCKPCFDEQKDPIRTAEGVIYKREFGNKVKHIEEAEEPWVQCGLCDKWVHMICGLFNNRRNFGEDTTFVCAPCLNEKRKKQSGSLDGIVAPLTKKIAASDLPHTTLSLFLENRINECLGRAYKEIAAKTNASVEEVERCPRLSLRQVSSYDKNHVVKEGVLERYKHKQYPAEFPCRTKCLVLFQNIDGQDVILFGMYVYEYGHKCPAPNQRRVYISYLDSVHYFRPRQYRTLVYHEIIISYLEYVKLRGFHTAHIWACPPLKGDDYILYCHPTDQKTPKDDKLRKWYADLLVVCKERGIVTEITDIYHEYLKDPTNDATVLPYLDGDYWTNEAEEIIKDLRAGKLQVPDPIACEVEGDDDDGANKGGRRNKNKAQNLAVPTGGATRPNRAGKPGICLRPNERDPVMAKLAAILEPMKEAFFVARLHPKEYALEKEEQRKRELVEEAQQNTEAELAIKKQALQDEALSGQNMTSEMSIPVNSNGEQSVADKDEEDFGKAAGSVEVHNQQNEGGPGLTSRSDSVAMLASVEANAGTSAQPSLPAAAPNLREKRKLDSLSEISSNSAADLMKNESKDEAQEPTTPRRSSARGRAKGKGGKKDNADKTQDDEMEVDADAAAAAVDAPTVPSTKKRSARSEDKEEEEEEPSKKPISTKKGKKEKVKEEEDEEAKGDATTADVKQSEKSAGESETATVTAANEVKNDEPVAATEEEKKEEEAIPDAKKILDERGIPRCFANMKDDTEDVDETQDSEHFDARTSFLSLCQGNHYQFDQLRRAKHSSMMVLYHLHNPDAPKFTPNCHNCHLDINVGYRHHCAACVIDFCHACISRFGGRTLHPHPGHNLRPIDITGSAPTQLTEEQKRERQRNIAMHMTLLTHAANCSMAVCPARNCQKMKDFLKHDSTCTVRVQRGCPLCKRINNLLALHARQCKEEICLVPKCHEIRDQYRQAAQRQQQMDDSRRRMMNDMYRPAGTPSTEVKEEPVNEDD